MHIPLFRVFRSDGDVQVTVKASDYDCPSIQRLPCDGGNTHGNPTNTQNNRSTRHSRYDFTQLLRWYK